MQKRIYIVLFLLFLWTCADNNDSLLVDENIFESIYDYSADGFNAYTSEYHQIDLGEVKDLVFSNNKLFVATEDKGIFIYEIEGNSSSDQSILLSNELYINEIYKNIDWGLDKDVRSIHYIEEKDLVFAHSRFSSIYQGHLSNLLSDNNNVLLSNQECEADESHATQLVIESIQMGEPIAHVLYKRIYNPKDLEGNEVNLNYSIIKKHAYWYTDASYLFYGSSCERAIDIPDFEDCINYENCAVKKDYLSYNVNDMFYLKGDFFQDNYGRYFIAQNQDEIYSYALVKEDKDFSLEENDGFLSIIETDTEVKSIYALSNNSNKYVFAGTRNGCYITLLEEDGISVDPDNKLHIAENLTIYDIFFDEINQLLLLSCGSDGVLVYNWDGNELNPKLDFQINSNFAWKAKYYDGFIFIATKDNGLEIYKLEE